MFDVFIYMLILAPYALICWLCVLLFGKYKTRAFRKWALLLAVLLTPVLGIPVANRYIYENGF